MARNQPITEQRTTSRNLRVLTHLFGFLRPYRKNLAAALLALFIAAGALLGFGGGGRNLRPPERRNHCARRWRAWPRPVR